MERDKVENKKGNRPVDRHILSWEWDLQQGVRFELSQEICSHPIQI